MDEWLADWTQRVDYGLSGPLIEQFQDMRARHPWYWSSPDVGIVKTPPPSGSNTGMGNDVEQWRDLVSRYFPAKAVETMMCLMRHESGGNPNALNTSSGAAGLFQVMPFWWDKFGGERFDPETNVRTARWIYDAQGFGAWSPYNRGECH